MKFDLKTLLVLGGLAVTFGGFYYGTEYRLDHLEQQISDVKKENSSLKAQIQKINKKIRRLEK